MIRLRVNIEDVAEQSGIAAIKAALEDRASLHDAMAAGVEGTVRNHLQGLNSRSPNTNFYAQAAASVESHSDAAAATVSIPHRGMALRYYGGTVAAGASISSHTGRPTKNLAIPTPNVPVRNSRRLAPREAGLLAYIPNRSGGATTGYLVEGVEKTVTRGKNKGGTRIVAKVGGVMMFVLRTETTHQADAGVLPTTDELVHGAGQAAEDYVESFNLGGEA